MNRTDDKHNPKREKTNKSASEKLESILSSRKINEQPINDVSSSSLHKQEKKEKNQPESLQIKTAKEPNARNEFQEAKIPLYRKDGKDTEKTATNSKVVSGQKNKPVRVPVIPRIKNLFQKGGDKKPPIFPPTGNFFKFYKKDPKGCLVYGILGALFIGIVTGIVFLSFLILPPLQPITNKKLHV